MFRVLLKDQNVPVVNGRMTTVIMTIARLSRISRSVLRLDQQR